MDIRPGDKIKFIGCEIIYREACHLAAASPWTVDVEFLRKGLHDLPTADMKARIQQAVDDADARGEYKAVLLGYARCNDGLVGVRARSIPLVIPKAHDCITFFFGGRRAYRDYFDTHPGTYFHTTGWIERNDSTVPGQPGVMDQLGLAGDFADLVAKYGRENAEFIRESMGDWKQNYSLLCYLEMGILDESDLIERSRREAEENHWRFDHRRGDLSLLRRLFSGPWNKDFLVVSPGQSLIARNDDEIIGLAP